MEIILKILTLISHSAQLNLPFNEYKRLQTYFVDIVYEYVYKNRWFDKGVASFSLKELEQKYNLLASK